MRPTKSACNRIRNRPIDPTYLYYTPKQILSIKTAQEEKVPRILPQVRVLAPVDAVGVAHDMALPAVGDAVAVRLAPGHDRGVIERVLPRRSTFERWRGKNRGERQVLCANVDRVLIVAALGAGEVLLDRIARSLVLAADCGAAASVVLTKADRCTPEELAEALGQRTVRPDFSWPDGTVGEYDSDEYHRDPDTRARDERKRRAYQAVGLDCVTMTRGTFRSNAELDLFVADLETSLGLHRNPPNERMLAARRRLRERLFGPEEVSSAIRALRD